MITRPALAHRVTTLLSSGRSHRRARVSRVHIDGVARRFVQRRRFQRILELSPRQSALARVPRAGTDARHRETSPTRQRRLATRSRARIAPRALVDAEIVVDRVESRRPPARDRWKTRRPRRRRRRSASATATRKPPVARRFEAKRRWMITSYCDRSVRDRSGRCFRRGSDTADGRAR